MANDPSKTEKATPKRREKARSEGNVPKSEEVTKALTTAAGMLGLAIYSGVMGRHFETIFYYIFTESFRFEVTAQSVYALFIYVAQEIAILLMPILLFIAVTAWISLRVQVGALWTTKVFKFKWSKFNIINGLKGMFASQQTLVRLLRSLVQVIVIGIVPYMIIKGEFSNFLPLYYESPSGVADYMLNTGIMLVLYTLIPMIIIAIADLVYNRYSYEENLKMTKQEVKDEAKQQEGDPIVRQKQRQKMMQMMTNRMMQDVPKADVVVTNPTHIAVALRYNALEAPAPLVLAIGVDRIAEKIKEIARENNIPIRENVPLAQALYKSVGVGEMIPEELYKAVAAILASVWRLKGKMPGPK